MHEIMPKLRGLRINNDRACSTRYYPSKGDYLIERIFPLFQNKQVIAVITKIQ